MDGIKSKKKVYRIQGTEVQMLNTFTQTSNYTRFLWHSLRQQTRTLGSSQKLLCRLSSDMAFLAVPLVTKLHSPSVPGPRLLQV